VIAHCTSCGLVYGVSRDGEPETDREWTCDDCGGPVEIDAAP